MIAKPSSHVPFLPDVPLDIRRPAHPTLAAIHEARGRGLLPPRHFPVVSYASTGPNILQRAAGFACVSELAPGRPEVYAAPAHDLEAMP